MTRRRRRGTPTRSDSSTDLRNSTRCSRVRETPRPVYAKARKRSCFRGQWQTRSHTSVSSPSCDESLANRSKARITLLPTSKLAASARIRRHPSASSENPVTRLALAIVLVIFSANLGGQSADYKAPAPHFRDPDRLAKLQKAFPE